MRQKNVGIPERSHDLFPAAQNTGDCVAQSPRQHIVFQCNNMRFFARENQFLVDRL